MFFAVFFSLAVVSLAATITISTHNPSHSHMKSSPYVIKHVMMMMTFLALATAIATTGAAAAVQANLRVLAWILHRVFLIKNEVP